MRHYFTSKFLSQENMIAHTSDNALCEICSGLNLVNLRRMGHLLGLLCHDVPNE